ncbi:MAG: polysaccharide export protein [Nitrospiraceae bacterium]|nr:MAG: polysaccharide export protein [Nitrospiraceae bacterium]
MKKTSFLPFLISLLLPAIFFINAVFAQQVKTAPVSPEAISPVIQQLPSQIPPAVHEEVRGKTGQAAPQASVVQPKPSEKTVSAFEQFISGQSMSEISTNIRQFGYDLFTGTSTSFAPSTNVPVGPDYVIGPGDEIRISVWGKIEGNWNVAVDRDGKISLPKIGAIGVTGLTFSELKDVLRNELSKYYTGFEMNVSMGSLRTMLIYTVGNAEHPGAYTVSSLSTLVNAFFAAGGPGKTGTMRDIQLKREGRTVVHFDMYDFLLKGDKSKDVRLMPEDVIYIPPVGPLAGIAGNVNTPAIYELRGETRLLDLIHMAGGLTSVAFKGRIQVQRVSDHQFRTIFEGDLFDLDKKPDKNFVLNDGDLVKIFSVTDTENTATLAGAVANPGNYGITPGMTAVRDVIALSGGLLYFASNEAELTRVTVTPSGPLTVQMPVDVFKAMEGDPQHNIQMAVNDYLFVRAVPDWKLYRTVTVSGEVKFPGTYTIKKRERLSSLIERAGGFADRAYLKGAVFTRNSVKELQQKSLAEMVERLERELIASGSMDISSSLSAEEVTAIKAASEQKRLFIESLKRLSATGRMSIKLAHLRLLKNTEYDIELEEGDSLAIPMRNNVVNVAGAVTSRSSFVYSGKLDYKDYIDMAGGYAKYADEGNVYVLKVDGTARKMSNGFLNWNNSQSRWEIESYTEENKGIDPGDTIVVPEKLERVAWLRNTKDLTQILYQIAVTAGVLIVAY